MNILENKRVIGVSALFLAAFAGVTVLGFKYKGQLDESEASLKKSIGEMSNYNASELKPQQSTLNKVSKAVDELRADYLGRKGNPGLLQQFWKYQKFCVGTKGNGKTNLFDFKKEIEKAKTNLRDNVINGPKRCKLGKNAEDIGMADLPELSDTEIPLRRFQMLAAARVAEIVAGSANYQGAPAIDNPDERPVCLEKIYCAPTPNGETYLDLQESEAYIPLGVEVTFTAKRNPETDGATPDKQSPLMRVLNGVAADENFFFIPTGVSVVSESKPPTRDQYKAPEPAAEGADPNAPGAVIAVQKTGSADEKVRVHITFQVLYFTGRELDEDHPNTSTK